MLNEITVKKTFDPQDGYTDRESLYCDVEQQREDVAKCMYMLANHLCDIGEKHDWTKIEYFDDFAKDSLERLTTPNFKNRDWYNIHCSKERHHLNSKIPTDVDLFDVLESICDCIIAGKTRNGTVNPFFLILKNGILEKAYWNTVEKISKNIKVE